jgi:hypothetical protein
MNDCISDRVTEDAAESAAVRNSKLQLCNESISTSSLHLQNVIDLRNTTRPRQLRSKTGHVSSNHQVKLILPEDDDDEN